MFYDYYQLDNVRGEITTICAFMLELSASWGVFLILQLYAICLKMTIYS